MKEILQTILGWIIIIVIIIIIVKKKKAKKENNIFYENGFIGNEKENKKEDKKENQELEKRIDPEIIKLGEQILSSKYETYEKKEYLLTQKEYKFYRLLKPICNRYNLNIFTQVSLYSIVKTKNNEEFNKIKSKSIDFVIADTNCKIKICIELDDPTHIRPDRQNRDKFIKELFNQLDIKFLQVPVQSYYNMQQIEEKIKESL